MRPEAQNKSLSPLEELGPPSRKDSEALGAYTATSRPGPSGVLERMAELKAREKGGWTEAEAERTPE